MINAARILSLLLAMLLSGCIAFLSDSATVQGPISSPHGQYRVLVDQVRGPPGLSGHSAIIIARRYYTHTIWLPHAPGNRSTYAAANLKVDEASSDIHLQRVDLIGGTVTVDQDARRVIVDLTLANGPFSGNGEYPLKVP